MENQKEFIGYLIKKIRKYLYHNKITRDVKFNEDSVINCSDCEIEIIGDKSLEEQSVNENVDKHEEENDDDEVIEHDDKVEIDQDEIVINELNKAINEQNDLNKNKNENQIEQQE
jgi:hypothetical protein